MSSYIFPVSPCLVLTSLVLSCFLVSCTHPLFMLALHYHASPRVVFTYLLLYCCLASLAYLALYSLAMSYHDLL